MLSLVACLFACLTSIPVCIDATLFRPTHLCLSIYLSTCLSLLSSTVHERHHTTTWNRIPLYVRTYYTIMPSLSCQTIQHNTMLNLSPACLPTPPHNTTSPCPSPFLPTHPPTADIPARIHRFDGGRLLRSRLSVCSSRVRSISVSCHPLARLVSISPRLYRTVAYLAHSHTQSSPSVRPSVRLCIFPLRAPSNHFFFFFFLFFFNSFVSVFVPPTNAGPVPVPVPMRACVNALVSSCLPAYRLVPRVFVDTIGRSRQRGAGRCGAGLGWAGRCVYGVCAWSIIHGNTSV
ncbi:hypothetical protein BKA81DRAFT_131773 [Phyllosticta paracitricarpa]|uniref:Secreted protein n=1 Tax=Phyllosticta paracitricarpa TaxID=2016321 RepID=A0ABR1MVN8_9PEZI